MFTALMLALMMSLSLVACGNKTDDSNNADDANTDNNTEQTGGTLVLGTSADYAPYEFMYADDNGTMQYAGIDISAGQYIADELGMELQVENMSFDYLLTSLAKGDFDIVMAAIEVTPERLQSAELHRARRKRQRRPDRGWPRHTARRQRHRRRSHRPCRRQAR